MESWARNAAKYVDGTARDIHRKRAELQAARTAMAHAEGLIERTLQGLNHPSAVPKHTSLSQARRVWPRRAVMAAARGDGEQERVGAAARMGRALGTGLCTVLGLVCD